MNNFDEVWQDALRVARQQAAETGRGDVADYLRLRETNDQMRRAGINQLFDLFLTVASEFNRRGMALTSERAGDHAFSVGTATMVGERVALKRGIRTLTVEAGFPRLPQHGFVRGGGYAHARIIHFGIAKANQELLLVKQTNSAPFWVTLEEGSQRGAFDLLELKQHFAVFLEYK